MILFPVLFSPYEHIKLIDIQQWLFWFFYLFLFFKMFCCFPTVPIVCVFFFNKIETFIYFIFYSLFSAVCCVLLILSFLPDFMIMRRWFPRYNNGSEQKWLASQMNILLKVRLWFLEGLFECMIPNVERKLLFSQSRRNPFSFLLCQL